RTLIPNERVSRPGPRPPAQRVPCAPPGPRALRLPRAPRLPAPPGPGRPATRPANPRAPRLRSRPGPGRPVSGPALPPRAPSPVPPGPGRPASQRHETRDSVRSDAVDVRFHGVAPDFRAGAAGSGVADGDSGRRVAGGAVGLRLGLERGLGIAGL